MSQPSSHPPDAARTVDAVLKRVGGASHFFELEAIRFVDCRYSYDQKPDDSDTEVQIGIGEQHVTLDDKALRVSMLFEFLAPSPFKEEQDKRVMIRAKLSLEYASQKDRGQIDEGDAHMFGRVNGIYNAWPYLREYVQSCLVRLGLPPFELPLLRAGAAAQLAGLVDKPDEATPAEPSTE